MFSRAENLGWRHRWRHKGDAENRRSDAGAIRRAGAPIAIDAGSRVSAPSACRRPIADEAHARDIVI